MKRYPKAIFSALIAELIACLLFIATEYAVRVIIHPALAEWLPWLIPTYSPVTDKENYEALTHILLVIGAALAIFIAHFAIVRFDNERCEYMIDETDGLYTVKEGAIRYFPRYIIPDLIASAVSAPPLFALWYFLPNIPNKVVSDYVDEALSMLSGLSDVMGITSAILFTAAVIFLSRMLAGLISLSGWRGAWLSDISAV